MPLAWAGSCGRPTPACGPGPASASAAWTGLEPMPVLILVASATALAAVGLAAGAGRRFGATTRLPFGPFLALGLHAVLLLGPSA